MAKGIEIGIASETKAFKLGVDAGIIAPLEDAVDQLAELGKAKGPEQLEKNLEEAQDASKKLQRETKETAETIEKRYRDAYRELATNAETGTRKAGRGFDDLKDESRQSLRETAASIKDMSDGLEAVQEIAANAFVGFGPAGFAAGALAASGAGLVAEGLRTAQEAADELKRRLAAAYQAAAEEGRNFLDEAQIQAATLDIIFGDDQGLYQQAQRDARNLGLSTQEVVRALAGDQEALNHVLEITNGLEQTRNDKLAAGLSPMELRAQINSAEGQTLDEILARYGTQKDLVDANAAKAEEYLNSTRQSHEEIQKMNKALAETPKEVPVALVPDESQITAALQRNRYLNVEVQLTRNGTPVY